MGFYFRAAQLTHENRKNLTPSKFTNHTATVVINKVRSWLLISSMCMILILEMHCCIYVCSKWILYRVLIIVIFLLPIVTPCIDLPFSSNELTISYNAGSTMNRPVGTVATFSCKIGYTLNRGTNQGICQLGGTWTESAPTCSGEWWFRSLSTSIYLWLHGLSETFIWGKCFFLFDNHSDPNFGGTGILYLACTKFCRLKAIKIPESLWMMRVYRFELCIV